MLLSNVLLGLTAVYASLGEVQAVRRCPRRCPDTWEARELSPYPHICHDPQVTLAPVRGTSRSTKTSTSVSTTSVKLSATRPTATSSTSTWFKPTPGTSFLWSLGKAIPSNPIGKNNLSLKGMQVYDVDLFDSTPSQIAEYKKQGKKVVCYFSAGSFENGRSDASSFNKDCYCNNKDTCKLDGWEE